MPPAPSTFKTRYGPSRPNSPGPCAGARKSYSSGVCSAAGRTCSEGVSPEQGCSAQDSSAAISSVEAFERRAALP